MNVNKTTRHNRFLGFLKLTYDLLASYELKTLNKRAPKTYTLIFDLRKKYQIVYVQFT